MKAVIFGILTCICCHAFAEDKSTVTIVDADIIDGVENKIVKLVWHEDMNLIEASLSGQQDSFHAVVILLSGDTATIYGGHALLTKEVRQRPILAGDVLVLGPVSEERAHQLDQIPEVHAHLGNVNWADYKKWIYVHIPSKQTVAPSPSVSK